MKLKNPIIANNIRQFYFKNGWSHKEVQCYLAHHYRLKVCIRTLKYWKKQLTDPTWKHPTHPTPPIPPKATNDKDISRIEGLRIKTGWGANIIKNVFKFKFSESTIKRIIREKGLSRGSKIENKRIHWVKWQRAHPDSLWQIDSWKLPSGKWVIDIIDDCSRFCPGICVVNELTTKALIKFLENTVLIHGPPREILTDNGAENGLKSNLSIFDDWCKRHNIKHIRSRVHKPTTAGKVERFHQTVQMELPFCNNDFELFRYRYNHIRPHSSLHMKTPADIYFSLQIRIKGSKINNSKW